MVNCIIGQSTSQCYAVPCRNKNVKDYKMILERKKQSRWHPNTIPVKLGCTKSRPIPIANHPNIKMQLCATRQMPTWSDLGFEPTKENVCRDAHCVMCLSSTEEPGLFAGDRGFCLRRTLGRRNRCPSMHEPWHGLVALERTVPD